MAHSKVVLNASGQCGATLIEVIVFLVVIGVALSATLNVFTQNLITNTDPLIRLRAVELAQAQLDSVLARKFDENTPTGGVPACNSAGGNLCAGISPDADFDDVGDFNNFSENTADGYGIAVSVADSALAGAEARLITVVVTTPPMSGLASGDTVTLAAYKVNF